VKNRKILQVVDVWLLFGSSKAKKHNEVNQTLTGLEKNFCNVLSF
jgi:hypothetical protein